MFYYFQIFSLNVLVKNKKNNETEFNKWKTNVLVSNKNDPFLVEKNDNRVDKIYLHHEEEIFIRNLKKAIATLFQVGVNLHTRIIVLHSLRLL